MEHRVRGLQRLGGSARRRERQRDSSRAHQRLKRGFRLWQRLGRRSLRGKRLPYSAGWRERRENTGRLWPRSEFGVDFMDDVLTV